MKLSIMGTGYVGLVTGACFADHGNTVICADIDATKIAQLKRGEIPFFEPGLAAIVKRNFDEGRLQFTTDIGEAVSQSRFHFLCVGTPFKEEIGNLDIGILQEVAKTTAEAATAGDLLIVKSTVPPGTAEKIRQTIRSTTDKTLHVVSNPEFLKEGHAVEDFMKPDRIVVGVEDEQGEAAKQILQLYNAFVRSGNPILIMDNASAEMVKLASNGYLATRISYINEVANLCEIYGASVPHVRKGMGLDSRIGSRYLFPGLGYGGSCFPKDVQSMIHIGKAHPFGARILESVHATNQQQRQNFLQKITGHFGDDLSGKKFMIWGTAFKPDTDDIREAPSLDIMQGLIDRGATVHAYDPESLENIRKLFGDKLNYEENPMDGLEKADALCILTEWQVFRNPDFDRINELMNESTIFDGRNLFTALDLEEKNITYYYIGQPATQPNSS